uniref:Uncharacterized protein n=1 Tax=Anguilla anguilla TaxID=7936 RepID=A0A0E9WMU5_ANGAN
MKRCISYIHLSYCILQCNRFYKPCSSTWNQANCNSLRKRLAALI